MRERQVRGIRLKREEKRMVVRKREKETMERS